MIDAYSKSSEVHPTSITSETTTIEKLRKVFAIHGLPDMVASNYATDFPREKFRDFMIKNAILQVKIAPRHPSYDSLRRDQSDFLRRTEETGTIPR